MKNLLCRITSVFALFCVLIAPAYAADDIFIHIVNSSSKRVNVSNIACNLTDCPDYVPSISGSASGDFDAEYTGTGGVGGLIIFEVGTTTQRCRLTWNYGGSGGGITSVGNANWIPSAAPPGGIPTCAAGTSTLNGSNELNLTITISGF